MTLMLRQHLLKENDSYSIPLKCPYLAINLEASKW